MNVLQSPLLLKFRDTIAFVWIGFKLSECPFSFVSTLGTIFTFHKWHYSIEILSKFLIIFVFCGNSTRTYPIVVFSETEKDWQSTRICGPLINSVKIHCHQTPKTGDTLNRQFFLDGNYAFSVFINLRTRKVLIFHLTLWYFLKNCTVLTRTTNANATRIIRFLDTLAVHEMIGQCKRKDEGSENEFDTLLHLGGRCRENYE